MYWEEKESLLYFTDFTVRSQEAVFGNAHHSALLPRVNNYIWSYRNMCKLDSIKWPVSVFIVDPEPCCSDVAIIVLQYFSTFSNQLLATRFLFFNALQGGKRLSSFYSNQSVMGFVHQRHLPKWGESLYNMTQTWHVESVSRNYSNSILQKPFTICAHRMPGVASSVQTWAKCAILYCCLLKWVWDTRFCFIHLQFIIAER